MEKLLKYLAKENISQRQFARRIGTSSATFNRAIRGLQSLTLKLAVSVERETKGKITCKDLIQ